VLRIIDPRKLIHPIIKLRQQILDRLRRAVVEHQPELVALVAGPRLRAPRDVLAVGRVGGVEVAARRGADLDWLGRHVGQIQRKDAGAGADGRLRVEVLSEGQFPGVGRKGEAAAAFEREGRNVVGIVGREVALFHRSQPKGERGATSCRRCSGSSGDRAGG
jgi:hypothetical protein